MSLLDWILGRRRQGGPGQRSGEEESLGMTPYSLGDVLGGIAIAVSHAQYLSDQYTDYLRGIYGSKSNDLDALAIPNTQFERVRVQLKFSMAGIDISPPGGPVADLEDQPNADDGENEGEQPNAEGRLNIGERPHVEGQADGGNQIVPPVKPLPDALVYVRAADLRRLPDKAISTMDFDLAVDDVQVLPEQQENTPA